MFAVKCPVSAEARAWIERSLRWLRTEFGEPALTGEVLLPTTVLPPGHRWSGDERDLASLVARVCARMGVDARRVDVESYDDPHAQLQAHLPVAGPYDSVAGHYRRDGERFIVAINREQLDNPLSLTATLAHEVGHIRLLGEDRISPTQHDHEQLTDLTSVFFGFGVFAANAALEHAQSTRGWRTSRLGYLNEELFAYALAYYATLRLERSPTWAQQLDTNPRVYMRKGMKFLWGERSLF